MAMENKNTKVVAIGAHPDDFEIGAAMRLSYHVKREDSIVGIICSDGENGGERETRLDEAKRAAKKIGIGELYTLHFPDAHFPDYVTVEDSLEKIIKNETPSVAYIHFEEDTHQDHRLVSKASVTACRKVPNILAYKSLSTIVTSFHPHLFHIGLEEDFRKKEEILKIYQSQIKKDSGPDLEQIEIQSRFYASPVRSRKKLYAEPFCANHIVLNWMGGL